MQDLQQFEPRAPQPEKQSFPDSPSHTVDQSASQSADLEESIAARESESLSALLDREARFRRKDLILAAGWGAVSTASVLLWVLHPDADMLRNMALSYAGSLVVTASLLRVQWQGIRRRERTLIESLTESSDVRRIGPLIRALRVQNSPVRGLAKQALTALLPSLRSSDASFLGDAERAILLRVLTIPPNDMGNRDVRELFSRAAYQRELNLRIAILKALEQVGGAKELATVERLARETSPVGSPRVPQGIQAAARECLPYLRQRAEAQTAVKQLLRGSSALAQPDNSLLRAAEGWQQESRAELLLRPGETGG